MSKYFTYCFFKYIHSIRLGESLNVGLLIAFPQNNIIIFKYPNDLQRLKCAYNDFHEEQLYAYLKSFDLKARQLSYAYNSLNKEEFGEIDFLALIKKEFINEDEGALQISQVRMAVQYSDDVEQITEEIFYSYFEHFYEPEELALKRTAIPIFKRDEAFIISTLKDLIIKQNPILTSVEFKSRSLITNNSSLNFNFEWKNHGLHLVKPLSLDYRSGTTIEERAHSLHSKLHILGKETELEDLRFDVMVSKPQLSKFFSSYNKAVSILRESSEKTQVIEEEGYQKYSKQIADALTSSS